MYDTFSADYDRFVNWQNRLSVELPFIIEKLHQAGARQVLDAATGTGMHAIALAQCGFSSTGADLSQGMIDKARLNAKSAGVGVHFEVAGFGALAETFGSGVFDAVLCLGNSLPHLLSQPELISSLADFASCLRPGGLLLLQNRNFDAVMAKHERWMEPQACVEADAEWVFQRFYDFNPDGLITFNMVTLKRLAPGRWSQAVTSSRLRPVLKDELLSDLEAAGFRAMTTYGSMDGSSFDLASSSNLVVEAFTESIL